MQWLISVFGWWKKVVNVRDLWEKNRGWQWLLMVDDACFPTVVKQWLVMFFADSDTGWWFRLANEGWWSLFIRGFTSCFPGVPWMTQGCHNCLCSAEASYPYFHFIAGLGFRDAPKVQQGKPWTVARDVHQGDAAWLWTAVQCRLPSDASQVCFEDLVFGCF